MLEKNEIIIPNYIVDEIEKYKWKKANGNSGVATYENIFALIGLALFNKRITEVEANEIKTMLETIK